MGQIGTLSSLAALGAALTGAMTPTWRPTLRPAPTPDPEGFGPVRPARNASASSGNDRPPAIGASNRPGRTPAIRGAAHQRNADGDDAVLGSRLTSLSPEEEKQIANLRARDREVRAHEEAHRAAAGPLFRGGPTYEHQTGPDGRRYAVGGNVQIDTSPGKTPEETIRKAQRIQRAALAPAKPSGKDRAVAARAARMEADAKAQLGRPGAENKDVAGADLSATINKTGDAAPDKAGAAIVTAQPASAAQPRVRLESRLLDVIA